MSITIPAVVSWLFAIWWLVVGIRDFSLIRYDARGSKRYRKPLPLILCLLASIDLAALGYFLSSNERPLVFLSLVVFAAIWLTWSAVAKRSWRRQ